MDAFFLATMTILVVLCMAGAAWIIWLQHKALDEIRLSMERQAARFTEGMQELAAKVKAATLEEATRHMALMHETRRERYEVSRGTSTHRPDLTPEMAEMISRQEIESLVNEG